MANEKPEEKKLADTPPEEEAAARPPEIEPEKAKETVPEKPEAEPEPPRTEDRENFRTGFFAGKDSSFLRRIIIPVVIGILVVAVIALFAYTRSQATRLSEETAKRREAGEQVKDLEKDLSAQLSEVNRIKNNLSEVTSDRDALRGEVNSLQATQVQIKTQLETARAYRDELEKRLKAEKDTVSELRQSLREDREKQKELFGKIETLLDEKMSLQEKLVNLKNGKTSAVEMPEMVVRDATPSLSGTILAVNDRYDFVVFNRGENDGVTAGSPFSVFDGGKKVGEVIARRIFPEMTVADINTDYTHRPLKKRFTVSLNE